VYRVIDTDDFNKPMNISFYSQQAPIEWVALLQGLKPYKSKVPKVMESLRSADFI
jgi:hypothetical protein